MGGNNTTITEVFGLAGAIIGLASLAIIIVNGGKTAKIITASGRAFSSSIRAATFQ